MLLSAIAAIACWELLSLLRVRGAGLAAACLGGLAFVAGEGFASAWQRWAGQPSAGAWVAFGLAAQAVGVVALIGRG
ncbi:MAG: hypothetical protein LDL56_10420, partial [Armatimonadetes bacterium]|nr:hypothetical protein [Armatimonadota bacterium]